MDASLFQTGKVRSLGKKKLADGKSYELFYLPLSDERIADYFGGIANLQKGEDEAVKKRGEMRALNTLLFVAMCDEQGSPLFESVDVVASIPLTLRNELRDLILVKTSRLDSDLGNG